MAELHAQPQVVIREATGISKEQYEKLQGQMQELEKKVIELHARSEKIETDFTMKLKVLTGLVLIGFVYLVIFG